MSMTTLKFTIPAEWWLSANQRMHWAPKATATRMLRTLGSSTAHVEKVRGLGTCHVAAFIGYPRGGKADPANAAPTVKALIDGLVDAGVWPDDDSTYVVGPTYLRDPSSGQPGVHTVRLVMTSQEIPWLPPTDPDKDSPDRNAMSERDTNRRYHVNIGNPAPGFGQRAERALDDMGDFVDMTTDDTPDKDTP